MATGRYLAAYRMPDATIFSLDVALTKARNALLTSVRARAMRHLRQDVETNPYDDYSWEPLPPSGGGLGDYEPDVELRGQPLFPPGIDLEKTPTPGSWFDLFMYDSANPCTEGPGPSRGGQSPGPSTSRASSGSPAARHSTRMGGWWGGSASVATVSSRTTSSPLKAPRGFEPPDELRVDRSVIVTSAGDAVRRLHNGSFRGILHSRSRRAINCSCAALAGLSAVVSSAR